MPKKRISLFAFFISLLIVFTYQSVRANVGLVSFTATAQENAILIEWVTETELDNAGFIVRRSEHPVLDYEDISPFILARGSGAGGAEYEFLDDDALEGITYYYQLEAWDINNNSETFGPVSAIIGATPTSTATSTATVSNIRTPMIPIRPRQKHVHQPSLERLR